MRDRGGGVNRPGARRALVLLFACLLALAGLTACSSSDDPREDAPPIEGTGVRWVSGANGNFPKDILPWGEWTGRPVDLAMVFTNRDDWQNIVSPAWPLNAFTPDQFPGKLSIAQPMWPKGGDENACVAGEYDRYWAEFGRNLVKYGRPDAIVRLGWEFNGEWFHWYPRNVETWKECYRRTVRAIRSTAPDVLIDWTMTMHRDTLPKSSTSVWDAYPGDEYVDIIGIDSYDMWPAAPTKKLWDRQCNMASGLCTVIKVARERGKRFSVPEWGVVSAEGGGGDNPFYIEKMYETFRANADILAYEVYYNNSEPENVRSSLHDPVLNPKSSKRYLELFGAR